MLEKVLRVVLKFLGSWSPSVLEYVARPHRPRGFKLLHGLYWGYPDGENTPTAYCPSCASEARYVPMTRIDSLANGHPRTDGQLFFKCPYCKTQMFRFEEQEVEAIQLLRDGSAVLGSGAHPT